MTMIVEGECLFCGQASLAACGEKLADDLDECKETYICRFWVTIHVPQRGHATDGIRVNAVGPGFIRTKLVETSLDADTRAFLAGQHALGRMGEAEEVANLTAFLLSDKASFITGSYHLVDGGYTAQ